MPNDDIKFETPALLRDLCTNDSKYAILVVNNGS